MIKLSEPVLTLLMCPDDFQPPAAELQQNLRVQRSVTLLVCYNICYGWRSKFMSDLFRAAQRAGSELQEPLRDISVVQESSAVRTLHQKHAENYKLIHHL